MRAQLAVPEADAPVVLPCPNPTEAHPLFVFFVTVTNSPCSLISANTLTVSPALAPDVTVYCDFQMPPNDWLTTGVGVGVGVEETPAPLDAALPPPSPPQAFRIATERHMTL
jgi:hypothetical protein